MIGDHKQLPPYGVDKIVPLLGVAKDVKDALQLCEELISRHLKEPAIEELFEEVEANTDFGALCADALQILTMFETFVESEFGRQKGTKKGMPIARRLTEQRRMHPAIAKIVSDCFYGGELTTNPKKAALYRSNAPIVGSWSSDIRYKPITFIDLPYVRNEPRCGGEDRRPPWNIQIARQQRDELLAGDGILSDLIPSDYSDETYARVQSSMEVAATELSRDGWSHKYWFLIHPTKIDDYHSPRYQRFHLLKMLQMPPDQAGILDASAPQFVCAGRFIAASRALEVPVSILSRALNRRDGAFHRYWRVGTTEGDTGESQWSLMRDTANLRRTDYRS